MKRRAIVVTDLDKNILGIFTNAMAAYALAESSIAGTGTKEIQSGGVPSYRKASADLTKSGESRLYLINNHGIAVKEVLISRHMLQSTWP